MKTCTKCGVLKGFEDFHKSATSNDGYRIVCKDCANAHRRLSWAADPVTAHAKQRAYYRCHRELYARSRTTWMDANREKMLAYYRGRRVVHREVLSEFKSEPCLDCGNIFPPFVMEFDHVKGEKRFALGKMANHDPEAVALEIEKCELVCCACHRVRTQKRKGDLEMPKVQAFHEWLRPLKSRPCHDCNSKLAAVAMDFDHVRGSKTCGVARMWSWGRAKVLAEIAKCELVCANCHRIRTQLRRDEKTPERAQQMEMA